ncbi:xylose isomerase [Polynucleobacter yangtzensis]|uniref:Xylose isomerase n=1 Tax=Polynucleobacter yangtzensis TaxID=1743159 RepID=A0A9C7CC03_9BURK|nr:sugar phosphate isomerase/epimerase [Polynucleobacter yangtzensis]BDT76550.1 xylose isomerase [Polynucleobacter yangtzensis]
MKYSIGFMQGRLSEKVDGKIQAFPWKNWENEFSIASSIDLHLMEWTLDQERLYENPLMIKEGQARIKELCLLFDLTIPSLTGDCFMQAPFWKAGDLECEKLKQDFLQIADACAFIGIKMLVVPLVDSGRIENSRQEDFLVNFLLEQEEFFTQRGLRIIFESDFYPNEVARFIGRLPSDQFGINYDIGNSAALGFDPVEEFSRYGHRIQNVHIKDRVLNGTTVALGQGNANFKKVFELLKSLNYSGNYIMQTARDESGDHVGALKRYRTMTESWVGGVNGA